MITIFSKKPKIQPKDMIEVHPGVSIMAKLMTVPENFRRYQHNFSNKELGALADLARERKSSMNLDSWSGTLISQQADGTALNTSTTPTSILNAAAVVTLGTNFFAIGKVLRGTLLARLSNIVTTPGTITLDFRLGGIVAFNGGAMQMSTTAHTTLPLWWEFIYTSRAIGGSTTANGIGQGRGSSQCLALTAVADSATTPATLLSPNTAPAVGTGYSSVGTLTCDVFATFSISNIGNAIQSHQWILESLN